MPALSSDQMGMNADVAVRWQIETERHRVEVARLQSRQQRLLNLAALRRSLKER